jgi:TolB-like protein
MSFFAELKRRNVFRVGIAYVIVAWLIIQVADVVLDNITAPDWVFQVIMLVLVLGLPVALIFAWAFEMTPEGIKKEKDVDRTQSVVKHTGRKLDYTIIGVLAIALAYYVFDDMAGPQSQHETSPEPATDLAAARADDPDTIVDKSIAVLPFVNLSSDQEQEWFADGLTEEVLNALTKARDLLVTARTSSFKFKGTNQEIPEIAKQLGVAHILEGSVRKGGDRIRVTAQLIRAEDGFHLWSETYDRDEADVISIQEDLAMAIAGALKTAMDPEALAAMMSAGTRSVPAYEAYLEGQALSNEVSATGQMDRDRMSYEKFELARELDPEFSEAHWEAAQYWESQLTPTRMKLEEAGLTLTQLQQYFYDRLDRAIETASDPVDTILYRALKAATEFRKGEQIRLLEEYVAARPLDLEAWGSLSLAYAEAADFENAKRTARQVVKLVGKDPGNITAAVIALTWAGDYETAAQTARIGLAAAPDDVFLVYQVHRALLWGGHIDEARGLVELVNASDLPIYNKRTTSIRQACADGDRETAERLYQEQVNDGEHATQWLMLHLLGEKEQAEQMLVLRQDEEWPVKMTNWLLYPYFNPAPHPEVVRLLQRENINRPPPIIIPFACPPRESS